jgi:hypothetical protein
MLGRLDEKKRFICVPGSVLSGRFLFVKDDAEVYEHRLAAVSEYDISRFDVTMNDEPGVGYRGERLRPWQ